MSRVRACAVVTVAAVAFAACSTGNGEPQGLADVSTSPEAAPEPTTDPTSDETSKPSPTAADEPDPSFTQPWVPGDPSVIALPEALPVENAGDLSDDEQAVVDALGEAMAAWDAMLFGAPPDMTYLESSFSGALLASLQNYGRDAALDRRVTVGSPTRLVLRDVAVDEEQATVSACLYTDDWVEYVDGERGEPVEPVESYAFDAERSDDAWLFSDLESVSASC